MTRPFVFVDVRRFEPAWAESGESPDSESEEEERSETAQEVQKVLGLTKKKPKTTLPIMQWISAFDHYAVAAAVTQQWSFAASYGHKMACLKLARKAKQYGRHVGVRGNILSRVESS